MALNKFGTPRGIRTPTSGFGDRHAAVNTRDVYLVPSRGNDPLSHDYQSCALPLS